MIRGFLPETAWLAIILAALIGGLSPLPLRQVLRRHGVLDVPTHRSSHSAPTLRGGGLAPALGIAAGTVAWIAIAGFTADVWFGGTVVASALAAACVGLSDDLRPAAHKVGARVALQLAIGIVLAACLGTASGAPWWAIAAAAVALAAYVNMANFMDGINAISSLHGLVVGASYAGIGLIVGVPWLTMVGGLIAVAFVSFLPWNLVRPGMFLGDVGSYLLGASIMGACIGAVFAGVPIVAMVAPLSIYLADTLATLIRRSVRGEPILSAHRSHHYQRLTNVGLSHPAAALVVSGLSLVCAGLGALSLVGTWPAIASVAAMLVVANCYLASPRFLGDRLPPGPRSPLGLPPQPRGSSPHTGFAPTDWVVLGGSGFIGSALAEDLAARGYRVRAISAPRLLLDPAEANGPDVARGARTLAESDLLAASLGGAEVVINAAGLATPGAAGTNELYGANALLPAVVVEASRRAGVARVIHLSSAAVQGRREVLDETLAAEPFSPYSRSKALGERAALSAARAGSTDLIIVRATSVQGDNRPTTRSLQRVARSFLASVAAPGRQPTVVSSLGALVELVHAVGTNGEAMPDVVLQPWEGLSTREVLRAAGDREPLLLPQWLCAGLLRMGRALGLVVPDLAGAVRRVELMWMGQAQVSGHLARPGGPDPKELLRVLRPERQS